MTRYPCDGLPLIERVRYHYGPACRTYSELMARCFDPELFPRAWRSSSNGGPPGCAMALGKAMRELGIRRYSTDGKSHGDQLETSK